MVWTSVLMAEVMIVVSHTLSLRVSSRTSPNRRVVDYLNANLALPGSSSISRSIGFFSTLSMSNLPFFHEAEEEFGGRLSFEELFRHFVEVWRGRKGLKVFYPIRVFSSGVTASLLIDFFFMQVMLLLFVQSMDVPIGSTPIYQIVSR